METIEIFSTSAWSDWLLSQSQFLTVRQQIVLDLLMSVFFKRNRIPPKQRAKVIKTGDYSFMRYWLEVDLNRIAKFLYPKGSVKRPWEARARWIRRFVEEAQNLCKTCADVVDSCADSCVDTCADVVCTDKGVKEAINADADMESTVVGNVIDILEGIELNGTVLSFRVNYRMVKYFYTVKLPAPLVVPICLYRFPDSRVSPNAFIANRALVRDRKMNREADQKTYEIKLRSLLFFTGLQSPVGWKKGHDPWADGQRKWFYDHLKRAIEGYDLFSVAMDLNRKISTEQAVYITPKYNLD